MSGMPAGGIVTPEAVVLQFDTAGVGSRIAARLVDGLVQGALEGVFLLIAIVLDAAGGPSWLGVTFATFGLFVTTFGYSVLFETFWDGRSLGKAAFGLRVVTDQGAPIRFRHAAIRGALAIIELTFSSGLIAFFTCLLTEQNQRIGDILAGTLVLRERKATGSPQAISFTPPPGTEDYALTLDVSALTTNEYISIRSFLLRANHLDRRARLGLSDQLGHQFAARLQTQPPNWMPSEIFLVCVAAAYQRRHATA